MRVCGYMVVRLPERNFDAEGRGAYASRVPRVDGTCYGGVGRMPWFDVDEACDAEPPDPHLCGLRDTLQEANPDLTGLDLTRRLGLARELLEFSNRGGQANELIAVWSKKLEQIKGAEESSVPVEWRGLDVVSLGHWSLLEDGYFAVPEAFPDCASLLNAEGLLRDEPCAVEYEQRYRSAESAGAVEELIEEPYGVDRLWVGRLAAERGA